MFTRIYTHPSCLEHDPGPMHPETPARLRAVLSALETEEFALLERHEAPRAAISVIERVHRPFYVESVLAAVPRAGYAYVDHETVLCPASGEAALRAAGAMVAAVDGVLGDASPTAFCAVRPPGHHAEAGQGMGFCVFNNIAIGAYHARLAHGLERVAVVDFDVHHGNGSQSMLESDAAYLYASSHQFPCYPGTGAESERGVGNVVNVELPPGSGSAEFRSAYVNRILPAIRAFRPQLLLISAGFDGHVRDPLAALRLTTQDFAWVSRELVGVAREVCEGRVVSTLEGGYDLDALAEGAAAHVRALMAG